MINAKASRGFTLLEILIALSVFAVMSMMAYAGLAAILKAGEATKPRSEKMAQLQTTWYLLNEDLSQMINRPIRDEQGDKEPAFDGGKGNEILVLTRSVPIWTVMPQNGIQRVSYRFENGALYRQIWTLLDRTPETQFRRKKLIDAERVEINFYDENSKSWLPYVSTKAGVPKALEINIELKGLGIIRRSFLVQP